MLGEAMSRSNTAVFAVAVESSGSPYIDSGWVYQCFGEVIQWIGLWSITELPALYY